MRSRYHLLISGVAVALLGYWFSTLQTKLPSCRCRPWEPCWPTDDVWASFNASIDGHLVSLSPVGHVCHWPNFDRIACTEVCRLSLDSGWRASHPEALQDWVWEHGLLQNETCPVALSTQGLACHQGRVPLYSALVRSARHVREAIVFARRHNIRLVIKNTGHDGAGRSSAPNSFQIATNRLKGIQYHDNFLAKGATSPAGPAVSVEAGVMQYELYQKGASEGFFVIGGECPTVGAAGGFLQGGGVSSFHSFARGLAVDNVLEYEVVNVEGNIIIANDHQNQDLFWALKGGGGGTFGVVTQATVRTFPDDPTVVITITISASPTNDVSFWRMGVTSLLEILRLSNGEGVPGQFILLPATNLGQSASLTLYYTNASDTHAVENQARKHLASFNHTNNLTCSVSTKYQPKISSELRTIPDVYPESYGILSGTTLISELLFQSPNGPSRMAEAFSKVPMSGNDILFTSNLGGRVVANKNSVDTAMHPAWRSAAQLVTFVRAVQFSTHGKVTARKEMHHDQMPVLYDLEGPEFRVSYSNLGEPYETDFSRVYWGEENYRRLSRIKRELDPDDLFITRQGVGSERWDDEGICRTVQSTVPLLEKYTLEVLTSVWSVLASLRQSIFSKEQ